MTDHIIADYLCEMENRLNRPTMSLTQLALITAFLCVFVVPAVIALSMIVFPPVIW